MRSLPRPPRMRSLPLPPLMRSLPSLPRSASWPLPPEMLSLPGLPGRQYGALVGQEPSPSMVSSSLPPRILSLPPRPTTRSSPARAVMMSPCGVPTSESGPAVPVMVAAIASDARPSAKTAASAAINLDCFIRLTPRLVSPRRCVIDARRPCARRYEPNRSISSQIARKKWRRERTPPVGERRRAPSGALRRPITTAC